MQFLQRRGACVWLEMGQVPLCPATMLQAAEQNLAIAQVFIFKELQHDA